MTAVSQSYPNFLGGLNEQPDELKKPGQLVEALNVIPDPVVGLSRRPGFERISWKDKQGEVMTDQTADNHSKIRFFRLELDDMFTFLKRLEGKDAEELLELIFWEIDFVSFE